jgi:drug/metabolite transporter (DMT)-like permease
MLIASIAQLLLKKSSVSSHNSVVFEYLNIRVILGYCLMISSLLMNIYAMKNGVLVKEVSSMESLSYLFVPLLSFLIFNERLSKKKIVSICIIIVGVLIFFK